MLWPAFKRRQRGFAIKTDTTPRFSSTAVVSSRRLWPINQCLCSPEACLSSSTSLLHLLVAPGNPTMKQESPPPHHTSPKHSLPLPYSPSHPSHYTSFSKLTTGTTLSVSSTSPYSLYTYHRFYGLSSTSPTTAATTSPTSHPLYSRCLHPPWII